MGEGRMVLLPLPDAAMWVGGSGTSSHPRRGGRVAVNHAGPVPAMEKWYQSHLRGRDATSPRVKRHREHDRCCLSSLQLGLASRDPPIDSSLFATRQLPLRVTVFRSFLRRHLVIILVPATVFSFAYHFSNLCSINVFRSTRLVHFLKATPEVEPLDIKIGLGDKSDNVPQSVSRTIRSLL